MHPQIGGKAEFSTDSDYRRRKGNSENDDVVHAILILLHTGSVLYKLN